MCTMNIYLHLKYPVFGVSGPKNVCTRCIYIQLARRLKNLITILLKMLSTNVNQFIIYIMCIITKEHNWNVKEQVKKKVCK